MGLLDGFLERSILVVITTIVKRRIEGPRAVPALPLNLLNPRTLHNRTGLPGFRPARFGVQC